MLHLVLVEKTFWIKLDPIWNSQPHTFTIYILWLKEDSHTFFVCIIIVFLVFPNIQFLGVFK